MKDICDSYLWIISMYIYVMHVCLYVYFMRYLCRKKRHKKLRLKLRLWFSWGLNIARIQINYSSQKGGGTEIRNLISSRFFSMLFVKPIWFGFVIAFGSCMWYSKMINWTIAITLYFMLSIWSTLLYIYKFRYCT